MADHTFESAKKTLDDTGKTWVDRRDAAAALGEMAQRALDALREHHADDDTDVRMEVQKILKDFEHTPAQPAKQKMFPEASLSELVMACEKPGEREIVEEGERFRVLMTLKGDRKQTVYVEPFTRKDGIRLVRVFTFCGQPDEQAFRWALEANMKLVQSAVGLTQHEGQEQFALLRCFLDGEISKPEMHAAIKEIGIYGDWIERKMTGMDDL